MTPDEFIVWMQQNTMKIVNDVIDPAAVQLIAQIRRRVISTGEKAEGGQFSAYSDAYLKKRKGTSSFKNFSETGVMWKSFGIKDRQDTPGKSVIVARMDEDSRGSITNQGLMETHSNRENSELIEASKEEERVIVEFMNRKLQELWV